MGRYEFCQYTEKVSSLQLQITNNDVDARKKALVDYVYVVVGWDWPTAPKILQPEPEPDELVRYQIATQ
jgi:hypothetical protein